MAERHRLIAEGSCLDYKGRILFPHEKAQKTRCDASRQSPLRYPFLVVKCLLAILDIDSCAVRWKKRFMLE